MPRSEDQILESLREGYGIVVIKNREGRIVKEHSQVPTNSDFSLNLQLQIAQGETKPGEKASIIQNLVY